MALTENEKKIARAYNIGYLLSTYEPRLLDAVIKRNPNNEFVKAMQVGKDHREFNANIPRKDYSPEFKNGFHNGRTLVENNPELLQRLITSKSLKKDYKNGLMSAQKEYEIKGIHATMSKQPQIPPKDLADNKQFQKGFNTGYRLAENYAPALKHAEMMNERYSTFIEGIKAGKEQYSYDLSIVREKEPNAQLFPSDRANDNYESGIVEGKVHFMNEISNHKHWVMERQQNFDNVPTPKWLNKKEPAKKNATEKQKSKDKGLDHDR